MTYKLVLWIIKKYFLGSGPFMLQIRDQWIFIDRYGQVWALRETAQPDMPIVISILIK